MELSLLLRDSRSIRKSLSTSTGVVPLSKLAPLLPNLHSDVITQFLCHLEFCYEITDSKILSFLLASTCLTETQAERFFSFLVLWTVISPQMYGNLMINFLTTVDGYYSAPCQASSSAHVFFRFFSCDSSMD